MGTPPPVDRAERDRVVQAHLGLANHLARRFAHRGEPLDDLEQVAALALVKAVDRFDPERGLEFSTFAVPTIVGELKRHFRDKAWGVRVPRRLQDLHLQVNTGAAELGHELRRSPTAAELASHLGVSTEEVLEAIEAGQAYRSDSLDTAGASEGSDQDPTPASRLGGDDPAFDALADRDEVAALVAELPPRERAIILLRFFGNLSQSQIAERIGISQMHVSRLLRRSLEHLRERSQAQEAHDEEPPSSDATPPRPASHVGR